MNWDWLDYPENDNAYRWEIPAPRPARSLHPSPRHTPRALGQRAPKPVIRSWLGGRSPNPLQPT